MPDLGFPDDWKIPAPKLEKPHRIYLTISVPLTLEADAIDGQQAWDRVAHPNNRPALAQQIAQIPPPVLVQAMSLQGYVEQLDDPSDASGRGVLGDQESGPIR